MRRSDEACSAGGRSERVRPAESDTALGVEDGVSSEAAEPAAEIAQPAEKGAEPAEDGISSTSVEAGGSEDAKAQRALAEHNALARVFDDVREQSRDGKLVQPTRWPEIGLVPDHMDPEEFEMFVYDYWEERHPDLALKATGGQTSDASDGAGATDAADTGVGREGATHAIGSGSESAEAPHAVSEAPHVAQRRSPSAARSSSIPSVGVPPFLRHAAREQGGDSDGDAAAVRHVSDSNHVAGGDPVAEDAPVADSPASASSSAASAPAGTSAADRADAGASSRGRTDAAAAASDADDDNPFAGLRLPEGYKLAQLEGEWVLVPDEDARPVELTINCDNIVALVGHYSYYLYDRTVMTDAFAHWAFLAAEDDELVTFADCVREESRTYPRPMPLDTLENDPFNYSDEQIMGIWDKVRASGDYPDIQRVDASNGDVFFFSTRYLTPAYARSLAEWTAVERPMQM